MQSVVYIFESPSADDFIVGRQEGEIISKTLNLTGISNYHFTVVNMESFEKCIKIVCELIDADPHLPIIHISAHGSPDGIQLTSEGCVTPWKTLRGTLQPLSDKSSDELLICFSTCHGRSSFQMAAGFKKVFKEVVGPEGAVPWSESVIAFSAFYHLHLLKGLTVKEAVIGMNAITGSNKTQYMNISGDTIRKAYTDGFTDKLREFLRSKSTTNPQNTI